MKLRFPLSLYTCALSVVSVIVAAVLVSAVHSYFSTKTIHNLSLELLSQNLNAAKTRTTYELEKAPTLLNSTKEMLKLYPPGFAPVKRIEKSFVNLLIYHPEFSSFSWASGNGAFIIATSMDDNSIETISYSPHENPHNERKQWDRNGIFIGGNQNLSSHINPFSRSWYSNAIRKQGLAWTEPHTFKENQLVGITCSLPIYNEQKILLGVVAVDITLEHIQNSLSPPYLPYPCESFIIDPKKRLLTINSRSSKELEPLSHYPKIQKAYELLKKSSHNALFFSIHKQKYVCAFDLWQLDENTLWTFGVITPFFETTSLLLPSLLGITLIIIIASIAGALFYSRCLSYPLQTMHKELQKIQNFETTNLSYIPSKIEEIQRILEDLTVLKASLSFISAKTNRTPKTRTSSHSEGEGKKTDSQ